MSEYIDVKLTLPMATIASLNAITHQGLLGDTRDEVMQHILRQYLYEENLRVHIQSGNFKSSNPEA